MKSVRLFLVVVFLNFFSSYAFVNQICGLPNIGNNCYLNASLQCLFQIPEVISSINLATKGEQGSLFFCKKLIDVFKRYNEEEVLAEIIELCEHTNTCFFNGSDEQQDAFEFFFKLIDSTPLLQTLFSFAFNTKIICTNCSAVLRSVNQTKYDLSPRIFQRCITNMDFCPNCLLSNIKVSKEIALNNFPPYLLIDCERICDGNVFVVMNKLNLIRLGDSHYKLIGAILHTGSSKEGHYIACVKEAATSQWYLCDDMNIYKLSDFCEAEYEQFAVFSPRFFLYAKQKT